MRHESAGGPEGPSALYRLCQLLLGAVLNAFWRMRAEGVENIPRAGGVIVAVNHRSYMDPLLAGVAAWRVRYPRFMGKEELFRHPLVRWFLRHMGAVPLDRSKGDVPALRWALQVVEGGGCLFLFPEGTRSRTGAPGRPKPGIAFLAHKTGVPVVPARVFNTEGFPRFAPLRIRFGAPMRFEGTGGRGAQGGRVTRCPRRVRHALARSMEISGAGPRAKPPGVRGPRGPPGPRRPPAPRTPRVSQPLSSERPARARFEGRARFAPRSPFGFGLRLARGIGVP